MVPVSAAVMQKSRKHCNRVVGFCDALMMGTLNGAVNGDLVFC
jgi:hypothetical protein